MLDNLTLVRVSGKPFSVSEYDHPAPSEFVCEMYPELVAFAFRPDWECPRFGRDFARITAVSLDARPLRDSGRVLVTLAARASNQGLVWNAAGNSVGSNWGHGPTIAERVPATITLAGVAGREVYALAPDGSQAKKIKTTTQNGALTFTVQPRNNTLHYDIVVP